MCIYNAQSHAEKVQSILHKIGGQSDSHRILKRRIKTHEAVYILYIHNFSSKSGFSNKYIFNDLLPKNKIKTFKIYTIENIFLDISKNGVLNIIYLY